MENLEKIWSHAVTTDERQYGTIMACCYVEDIALFVTHKNFIGSYHHFRLENSGFIRQITDTGKIKWVRFLPLSGILFGATDFDMHVMTRDTFQSRFYFVMPKPISELAWNPTENMLAVTFDSHYIVLYLFTGYSFEPLYKEDLPSVITSTVYDVACGILFRGPLPERIIEHRYRLPSFEPPKVLWFKDGECIAVNFHINGQRFIKVFDKNLKPLYMSEDYVNLGRTLSSSPDGELLASSAAYKGINKVVIFEKKCAVREEFDVPENKGKIEQVEYHPNMELLAVSSIDDDCLSYVNLYLRSNAQWYLKHQLFYPYYRIVRHIQWIHVSEETYTTCKLVVFTSENIEYHSFRFIINRRPGSSLIATVRGNTVAFYNYSETLIPPPLTPTVVTFSKPVNRVMFHPTAKLVITIDSFLHVQVVDLETYSIVLNTKNVGLTDYAWFHHVEWTEENRIVLHTCSYTEQYPPTSFSFGDWELVFNTVEKTVHYIVPYSDTESLISYSVLNENASTTMYITRKVLKLQGEEVVLDFYLNSNFQLFMNKRMLQRGITSFLIQQNYMFFTTRTHLYCLRIDNDFHIFDESLNLNKIYSRQIETGSRIATVSTDGEPQIILTVPRGNIEVISCKLIAVDTVDRCLIRNDWSKAVTLIRLCKLNWNVLIDLNPARFIANLNDFLRAVEHGKLLTAIIGEIGVVDDSYKLHLPATAIPDCDKHHIILMILDALHAFNSVKNLVPIVLIQQKHVSIRDAVWSIKQIFLQDNCHDACKLALKALLLKDHIKVIVKVAYTFHDVNFLRFIYVNSSEDPAVYLPELQKLTDLDLVHRKYYMSVEGGDFKGALRYLTRCSQYDAEYVEVYIVKHELQAYAYATLPDTVKHYTLVCQLYGAQLSRQRKYAEAGLVLKKANLLGEALEEYKKALDWREVVIITNLLNFDKYVIIAILYQLADDMADARKVDEAVMLVEHYIKDNTKAIELYVNGKSYKKALDLARSSGELEMIDDVIIPMASKYMGELSDKIREHKAAFEKYVGRLNAVRENKTLAFDNRTFDDMFESDSLSVYTAPSSSSSSRSTSRSRSSTSSARNRRKEERKKTDLREGGYYEDIALIRALYLLYMEVFSLGQEVREIGLALEHGDVNMARLLHDGLAGLQAAMLQEIPVIWHPALYNTPEVVDNNIRAIIQNKADLDPKYSCPPPDKVLNAKWKLEMFSVER